MAQARGVSKVRALGSLEAGMSGEQHRHQACPPPVGAVALPSLWGHAALSPEPAQRPPAVAGAGTVQGLTAGAAPHHPGDPDQHAGGRPP